MVGVDFYADGILLDIDTSAPYTWNWTATTPASHTLSAIARDESSSSVASSVTISVTHRPGQFNDTFALRGTINGSTRTPSTATTPATPANPVNPIPPMETGALGLVELGGPRVGFLHHRYG